MITAVTGISNSTVRVMWTRPAVLNGILATYTIVYNSNDPVTVNYNGQPVSPYISFFKNCLIKSVATDAVL